MAEADSEEHAIQQEQEQADKAAREAEAAEKARAAAEEALSKAAADALIPRVSITVHSVGGEVLWGPEAVKSSLQVKEFRKMLAVTLQMPQYKLTLLKGPDELELSQRLGSNVCDGDVLTAAFGLTVENARYVLRVIESKDPRRVSSWSGSHSAQAVDQRCNDLAVALGVDPADSSGVWSEEIRPWLEAWLLEQFSHYQLIDVRDGGLIVLDEDGSDDTLWFTILDVAGGLASLKGGEQRPGVVFKVTLWDDDLDGDDDSWKLTLDVLRQLDKDWTDDACLCLQAASLTELLTNWALTGDRRASSLQVRTALRDEFQCIL
eukprot:TRINITY_DN30623_c0_g1_i2.p1 TRINITY_DN30623_c0_g1~~TRINITY_DN30623_c0_g1_i2.p1  ORF type:complete len:353 (+),score=57.75 TRINITY_DN30623_c0_g1_i2:102-1061(+)